MPRLWTETIETHRREVHEAVLDTTWRLATEHGLLSVTMSRVAEQAGIGRATLYKYFPDVEAILVACHERHVAGHLERLAELRDRPGTPGERLEAVLEAYALIRHTRARHGTPELGALLHRGEHVDRSQQQVHDLIQSLLAEAARIGDVRSDVRPDELAAYCLHALNAAGELSSPAAVHRLVTVTQTGLHCGAASPDPPSASLREQ